MVPLLVVIVGVFLLEATAVQFQKVSQGYACVHHFIFADFMTQGFEKHPKLVRDGKAIISWTQVQPSVLYWIFN